LTDAPSPQTSQEPPEELSIPEETMVFSVPDQIDPLRSRLSRWPSRWVARHSGWKHMRLKNIPLWKGLGRWAGGDLVRLLGEHLEVLAALIRLARLLTAAKIDPREAYAEAKRLEAEADKWRIALIATLADSLVTPFEPEDLYRFSRGIDDVVDNLRDFIREWVLYNPTADASCDRMLESLDRGVASLKTAVGLLRGPQEPVSRSALGAKRSCNHVRRRYQTSLAQLFQGELTMDTLRSRELLRRLDVVGLRLGEAVDVLLDAAVKRS